MDADDSKMMGLEGKEGSVWEGRLLEHVLELKYFGFVIGDSGIEGAESFINSRSS